MPYFHHDGFDLRFERWAGGDPILLVHGFASNLDVNWVNPGWVKTLGDAGYRVIAFDHRGHGRSTGSRNADDYTPQKMASDCIALLDRLDIPEAHLMGYSMGARVAATTALLHPQRVRTLCLGGIGDALVHGTGFWGPVRDALLTGAPETITDAKARMFRTFADQTGSDRHALGACIEGSRTVLMAEEEVRSLAMPTLVAVGTRDDIAGDAAKLAAMIPAATHFPIEGRDHMLAVGDRTFKARYLDFLNEARQAN